MFWYDNMAMGVKPPAPAKPIQKENKVDKAQADRIESMLRVLLEQVAGRETNGIQEFNGWEQGGQRTLYDLTAANAAKAGVPGTRDTKEK